MSGILMMEGDLVVIKVVVFERDVRMKEDCMKTLSFRIM